jgi:Tol biopolymer transport system component
MKFRFKGAAILSSVVMASGYATVAFSKSPPPPPPPYNPQVLYTVGSKGGSTATITVSNADGTDVVSLYTSKNITGLNDVKFSTTANQIVFSEQNDIKVLTYAVSPQNGVTTTSVSTLASEPYTVLHVDVSPDGSELLFVEHTADPNQYAVYVMSRSGGGRTQISLMPGIYPDAVWAHSNSSIAVIQGAPVEAGFGVQTIQVIDLTNNGITTVFNSMTNQLYQVSRLESAHTSDTLLFYATPTGSNTGVYTVDIGGMHTVTPIVAGWSPSFSSDDSMILFRGNATGDLFTLNSANVQTQITSRVVLGRPDFLP